MLGYYLKLALRSCKRNKVLTALMVLAIALGRGRQPGVVGGVLGLGLALLGLWAVRQRPTEYAALAQLDAPMLLLTLLLALLASVLTGLLPAWRAMRIAPAIQLKSQ